jgi:hypothetical protein
MRQSTSYTSTSATVPSSSSRPSKTPSISMRRIRWGDIEPWMGERECGYYVLLSGISRRFCMRMTVRKSHTRKWMDDNASVKWMQSDELQILTVEFLHEASIWKYPCCSGTLRKSLIPVNSVKFQL